MNRILAFGIGAVAAIGYCHQALGASECAERISSAQQRLASIRFCESEARCLYFLNEEVERLETCHEDTERARATLMKHGIQEKLRAEAERQHHSMGMKFLVEAGEDDAPDSRESRQIALLSLFFSACVAPFDVNFVSDFGIAEAICLPAGLQNYLRYGPLDGRAIYRAERRKIVADTNPIQGWSHHELLQGLADRKKRRALDR